MSPASPSGKLVKNQAYEYLHAMRATTMSMKYMHEPADDFMLVACKLRAPLCLQSAGRAMHAVAVAVH